jgi:phage terminase large subunit
VSEHVFRVRPYQAKFHKAFVTQQQKRFIEIAHRRWGKDEIALNATRDLALARPASYWHCPS